jgi:hypothetical protein
VLSRHDPVELAWLDPPVLWPTIEVEPLSSSDEFVESVEVVVDEEDDDELALVAEVAPQRNKDATPVTPRLRMLTVAVRFLAACLPFSLRSIVPPHPCAVARAHRDYVPAIFFEAA